MLPARGYNRINLSILPMLIFCSQRGAFLSQTIYYSYFDLKCKMKPGQLVEHETSINKTLHRYSLWDEALVPLGISLIYLKVNMLNMYLKVAIPGLPSEPSLIMSYCSCRAGNNQFLLTQGEDLIPVLHLPVQARRGRLVTRTLWSFSATELLCHPTLFRSPTSTVPPGVTCIHYSSGSGEGVCESTGDLEFDQQCF